MELLLLDHVEVEKVMIAAKPNITETCYIVANIGFPICITRYAQTVLKKEPLWKFANCSNLRDHLKFVSTFFVKHDINELSLKRGFGGCGHRFGGCEGFDGSGGFGF